MSHLSYFWLTRGGCPPDLGIAKFLLSSKFFSLSCAKILHKNLVVSIILLIFAGRNIFVICGNMRTLQEYIELIRAHQSELQERFGITSMRLFGSVARGEQREGSDVDLFVTMPPKMFNYILAAQYLEQLLGCSVDLIRDHNNLRPFFRQQIERDGIIIFTAA